MVTVEQQVDGKFKLMDGADTLEKDVETEAEANALKTEYESGDKTAKPDLPGEGNNQLYGDGSGGISKPVETSEHNPHGLDIHQRLSQIIATLKKHGIHHSETAPPAQNPQMTADKFAKPPQR